ncbi:three prime repair exonuclease 2-like [Ambystoma mexicanum]|uniref:three prime repair exonuclease 2-like n=1 Tax=Ambystoma mexicanum TaxID=8296 RepID=UPI0037E99BA0
MYSKWNVKRTPFETFVFMDLEATGLPPARPKITEISLLAVNRHSLENTAFTNSFKPVPRFPRVVDKLCLCIDPGKPISQTATTLTGLDNEVLKTNGKQTFNMYVVEGIKAFLNRQCAPVCFVSHNGYRYDFPLLKAELSACGCSILDKVYCADSLTAIRSLDSADSHFRQFACQYKPSNKKGNYSLSELYFTFFREYPVDCHTAEGDTVALIGVFQWRAKDLIEWMELNAKQFADIKPMYKDSCQEEAGNVLLLESSWSNSSVPARTAPQASDSTFCSDELECCGPERRNYRKRLHKREGNEDCTDWGFSSTECLNVEDHPENVNSTFKEKYCLILVLLFVFFCSIIQNGRSY